LSQAQSSNNRSKMAYTAELVRRGATILQEPCPRCGGVQIKYRGKIFCTNEDDLEVLLNPETEDKKKEAVASAPPGPFKVEESTRMKVSEPASPATESLRKLLEEKLDALSKQLDSTTDIEEQARILDLISKYLETLEKTKRSTAA